MPDPTSDPRPSTLAVLDQLSDDELRLVGRLVAVLAQPKVVRTERVELVDAEGNVRVVIGNLAGEAEVDDYFPGLALIDAEGTDRVALMLHDTGSVLSFSLAGNDALLMGVDDPGLKGGSGPYLELLRRSGAAAIGWRVTDDVLEEQSPPRQS